MARPDFYEANFKVRDMPRLVDNVLTTLACLRGCAKWVVVKDALVEYAESHASEIKPQGE